MMTPALKKIAKAHGFESRRVGSSWRWVRNDGAVLSYGYGRLVVYLAGRLVGALPTPEEFGIKGF